MTLFDFSDNKDLSNWTVVNDGVMGGESEATFLIHQNNCAVFQGTVSLQNNGGFSSVRYRFAQKNIEDYNLITIRLKGDGKRYQFRIKTNASDRHAYTYYFQTTSDWQIVQIPLAEMTPRFRGRTLEMGNYPSQKMEEIAFFIANKRDEKFKLELDRLTLK